MIEDTMNIIKLEKQHRKAMLEQKLQHMKQEHFERTLNSGIQIIAEKMRINTLLMFLHGL
jgi:hypothetical protein